MDELDPFIASESAAAQAENAAVDRGLADIEAGRVYKMSTVMAWLDRLDEEPATPMPEYD